MLICRPWEVCGHGAVVLNIRGWLGDSDFGSSDFGSNDLDGRDFDGRDFDRRDLGGKDLSNGDLRHSLGSGHWRPGAGGLRACPWRRR